MGSAPAYRIKTDPPRNQLRLTFSGHMNVALLDAFEKEFEAALALMAEGNERPDRYLVLVDLRQQQVQQQDVVARFQAIVARFKPSLRRIAVVMSGSVLHKMQAQRIGGMENHAIFCSEEDALNWLVSEGEQTGKGP